MTAVAFRREPSCFSWVPLGIGGWALIMAVGHRHSSIDLDSGSSNEASCLLQELLSLVKLAKWWTFFFVLVKIEKFFQHVLFGSSILSCNQRFKITGSPNHVLLSFLRCTHKFSPSLTKSRENNAEVTRLLLIIIFAVPAHLNDVMEMIEESISLISSMHYCRTIEVAESCWFVFVWHWQFYESMFASSSFFFFLVVH